MSKYIFKFRKKNGKFTLLKLAYNSKKLSIENKYYRKLDSKKNLISFRLIFFRKNLFEILILETFHSISYGHNHYFILPIKLNQQH